MELAEVPGRNVPLAASELQSYIDALPRLLTANLTLLVSGELNTAVEVNGFYGPGSLTIVSGSGGFTLGGQLHIQNCSAFIYITRMDFQEPAGIVGDNGVISAERCGCVRVFKCGFTGLGEKSGAAAVEALNGTHLNLSSVQVAGFHTAVLAGQGSILSIDASEGENLSEFRNNARGAYAWRGGIVLLSPNIPDTLGGSANLKFGGLIASADGTLL